jgi:hypothetical protein
MKSSNRRGKFRGRSAASRARNISEKKAPRTAPTTKKEKSSAMMFTQKGKLIEIYPL